jgi:hypothetical protein
MHSLHGGIVVTWLACNIPKPLWGKVGTKDKEFLMIISANARILEDGFAHIIPSSNRNQRSLGTEGLSIFLSH